MPFSPKQPLKKNAKTAIKQRQVSIDLKQRIIAGEFAPGDRLPPRLELVERYGMSSVTIQRALDMLREQRFIRTGSTSGTFVADQLPHLHDYALIFSLQPGRLWTHFFDVIEAEAQFLARELGINIHTFYNVDGTGLHHDERALVEAVTQQRLAGVIFVAPPDLVGRLAVWETSDIPLVALMNSTSSFGHRAAANVRLDGGTFWTHAFGQVEPDRRDRTAVLLCQWGEVQHFAGFQKLARSCGVELASKFVQLVSAEDQSTGMIPHLIELMFDRPAPPRALVVADDHHVAQVASALMTLGISVPRDVQVIAHCNFPLRRPAAVPFIRLGFDLHELLRRSIGVLQAAKQNKRPADVILPTRFEHEIPDYAAITPTASTMSHASLTYS